MLNSCFLFLDIMGCYVEQVAFFFLIGCYVEQFDVIIGNIYENFSYAWLIL